MSQTSIEQITEPDFMITFDHSDGKDEQTNSWFKPGFINEYTNSSSTVVLNSVRDQPSETITKIVDPEPFTTDQPSSSNQALQTCTPTRTIKVPSPPTMFLDSTILADVCENIFQELNKLVQARNNLTHSERYDKQWRRLRERVDFVLSELQRSSLDAQNNLQDWFKGVVNNLQEVEVKRTQGKTQLCISDMDASYIIPSSVHPKELHLTWLTKINVKSASTELELLQRNSALERENKQLKKELVEQKLLLLEYKTKTEAKLEEARIREENLIRSNEDFKQEMKKQLEDTNKMLKEMM